MSEVSDRTALAVIPASAISVIVGADESDILGRLAQRVAAHKPDISTPKGRKEIASLAAEVASSKMGLIRLGKSLTEDWRKSTAAVNAECKVIEDRMDALKAQVRAPLTAFEEAEKARVNGHEQALARIQEPAEFSRWTYPLRKHSSDWIGCATYRPATGRSSLTGLTRRWLHRSLARNGCWSVL